VPEGNHEERELLLAWLNFLREAVLRKLEGLDEQQARWRPDGRLISLLGIVNHLSHAEWRWIDGSMRGEATSRSDAEFHPGPELSVAAAIGAYRARRPAPTRTSEAHRWPSRACAVASVTCAGCCCT
jgi:hypothetical protein